MSGGHRYRQASTRTAGPEAEAVLPRSSVATTCQGTVPRVGTGPSLADQPPERRIIGTDRPPQRRVTEERADSSVTVASTRVVVSVHGLVKIWGGEAERSPISGGCSTRRATPIERVGPFQVSSTRASASPSGRPSRVADRVSLTCRPPSRRPVEGLTRSQGAEGLAVQDSGSPPPLRTVKVAVVAPGPRSTLAGEAASDGAAGAVVAVVAVVVEVEVLVEAVVVGWVVGAAEVAAPAAAGPPWPLVGLETAGDRSHPSPTPTATRHQQGRHQRGGGPAAPAPAGVVDSRAHRLSSRS